MNDSVDQRRIISNVRIFVMSQMFPRMKEILPLCEFSGKPAAYQIGVARFDSRSATRMIGLVSAEKVEQGITHVMKQTFGAPFWATVHDLDGKLLYHSYDADQQGYSATVGWSVYLRQEG